MPELFYNTGTPLLIYILRRCMACEPLAAFRLVGGTALSLQRGHRQSFDIDLFTDSPYQSIDFDAIDNWFRNTFPYVQTAEVLPIGMGKPYFIGDDPTANIKLDLYYTDEFMDQPITIDGIRLAGINDIIAMKLDVISRGGRKKDFWDIHELLEDHSLDKMVELHKKRYPYTHDGDQLLNKLSYFHLADNDFNPRCLKGKHWELIKLDLLEALQA
ncbi:MAG: nucleotidyl transferase AbiEii/AbiGii toxin family protein, partial [Bacteroidales bacterium]|nr:nucleotidyl transferase AbiEii/AbiGii toxin family protein [Bacteroidales bacterium]